MAMWAGVQNVSRPIDMCQEMSQIPPTVPETTPATMNQIVQGIDVADEETYSIGRTWSGSPAGMVCDMVSPVFAAIDPSQRNLVAGVVYTGTAVGCRAKNSDRANIRP